MKKKILKIVACVALISALTLGLATATNCTNTTSEAYIPSETIVTQSTPNAGVSKAILDAVDLEQGATIQEKEKVIVLSPAKVTRVETRDKNELTTLIQECDTRLVATQEMKQSCETLGYEADHPVSTLAETERENAQEDKDYYQSILDEVLEEEARALEVQKWADREAEYPTATAVWKYLKNLGYNDYVTAGIIGNMMAEVGGQTLNLDHTLSSGTYHGLCQWKLSYYPSVRGASRDQQLDLLASTIEDEFTTFGYIYTSGFDYQSFLNMTDASDAALAFAKVYERCGSGSHSVRQSNADKAYDYFTN